MSTLLLLRPESTHENCVTQTPEHASGLGLDWDQIPSMELRDSFVDWYRRGVHWSQNPGDEDGSSMFSVVCIWTGLAPDWDWHGVGEPIGRPEPGCLLGLDWD